MASTVRVRMSRDHSRRPPRGPNPSPVAARPTTALDAARGLGGAGRGGAGDGRPWRSAIDLEHPNAIRGTGAGHQLLARVFLGLPAGDFPLGGVAKAGRSALAREGHAMLPALRARAVALRDAERRGALSLHGDRGRIVAVEIVHPSELLAGIVPGGLLGCAAARVRVTPAGDPSGLEELHGDRAGVGERGVGGWCAVHSGARRGRGRSGRGGVRRDRGRGGSGGGRGSTGERAGQSHQRPWEPCSCVPWGGVRTWRHGGGSSLA